MSHQVFITGMGLITSIGDNIQENLHSLLAEKSGIGKLTLIASEWSETLPVCEIKHSDGTLCQMAGVPKNEGYSRTALLGIIAAKEALSDADISIIDSFKTGIISATTVGGMREFERHLYALLDVTKEGDFRLHAHGTDAGEHTERIADFFGITAHVSTISTACSSASNAIIQGAELIKHGYLDRVICGGSDVLSKFTINGFNSLKILDKEHTRPFDASRMGVNLGEGAAFVVLESEKTMLASNKKPKALLSGYSNSNDAYHQTASSPDGDGAILSMQRSLDMAGLLPSSIDYINCHGTGTENNDLSEALAIQKLFSDKIPYFSSTKPNTGHTLAAAGCVEAIYSILSLQHGVVFSNLNFQTQMPECAIAPVNSVLKNVAVKHVISNSFGFGGTNTSLLFSKIDAAI